MKRDGLDKWNHDCYCDEVENEYRAVSRIKNETFGWDQRLIKMIKFYRLYGGKVIKQMHRDLLKARLKVKITKSTVKLMSIERGELQRQIESLNRDIKRKGKYISDFHNRPKIGSEVILKDIDGWLESVSRGSHNDDIRSVTERIVAIVLTGVEHDKQNDNG